MTREKVHVKNNKQAKCLAGVIDSQPVKTTRRGGLRGIDRNKKTRGRKRYVMGDTMGNIVTNVVHVANIHDSKGTYLVLNF